MRRLLESKVIVVVLAIAGLIALALLSAALRDLTFRPPVPFSFKFGEFFAPGNVGPGMVLPRWKYFMFGGLLLLVLGVIVLLLDPELRKRILYKLLRFGLSLVVIWWAVTYLFDKNAMQQLLNLASPGGAGAAAPQFENNIPAYVPPQINPWMVFGVSFVVGLALVLVGWQLYKHRPLRGTRQAMDEVAGIARDALNELQPGQNWDDAIVRAYIRMNEVVVAERGLMRPPGSTPSEFAQRMERIGLPGEAVRSLTSLFEGVRYGGKSSSLAERDLAAAALAAILHHCGRKA
jgi:hypothetical protein